jgi:tRNA U34 5-carboxymethylaminomethyl modifying enzyme MnmG/GidA
MGRAADAAGIQFRVLNRSKGTILYIMREKKLKMFVWFQTNNFF